MLKRDISYEDFNGNKATDVYYFNLTTTELISMQVEHEGGMDTFIKNMIDSTDIKALISEIQKIILAAYGVKSEDGKRFIKNDKLREEFSQTAAFDALFMELATNEDAAVKFINGILPADLAKQVETVQPKLPPVPPAG